MNDSNNNAQQALEQYKAKLTDLGNLGTRQSSMTMYYISIVSAIFGLLALKEGKVFEIEITMLITLCTVGILVCILWFLSLNYFRNLFRAKLSVLTQMETTLPFQTLAAESEIISKHKIKSWIRIERIVPIIFGLLFFVLIIIRVLKYWNI